MDAFPERFYKARITELEKQATALKRKSVTLSWLRLFTIITLASLLYFLWGYELSVVLTVSLLLLALFLFLLTVYIATEKRLANTNNLLSINREETEIGKGLYNARDGGNEFISLFRASNDLDIFGNASLFQYVNRAISGHGRETLAGYFAYPPLQSEFIEKQEAVKELAGLAQWRQQLQAFAMLSPITKKSESVILDWMEVMPVFAHPGWKMLRFILPIISLGALALHISGLMPAPIFYGVLIIIITFMLFVAKKAQRHYGHLSKIVSEFESFAPMLEWIEKEKFTSIFLAKRREKLGIDFSASGKIRMLKKIMDRFDYRLNPLVYIPLTAFLAWDLQQALALEKWKKTGAEKISHWFEVMGEMEALSSLANLSFNHPHWTFPVISEKWFDLEMKEAGHPLIAAEKRVLNDFSIAGSPQLAMITGSNMAGKSTFLRTTGVNMLLAMAAAPVCAGYMRLPFTGVLTSMRIADNLEEETSTFYAELKKIRDILEAVKRKEKVFLLIDEMLRGTNSHDRHTGSMALIRQLVKEGAVGIIASHDIALSEMENSFPGSIANYHFDSAIVNEEIFFDYLLKPGVSRSANASLLMKKMGIELDGN